MKGFPVAALVGAVVSLLGCGEDNPCGGEGHRQTEPTGLFAEIGLPPGAIQCDLGELGPQVFLRGMTEAEAAQRMREQMSKQGWRPLELPSAIQEGMARDMAAGGSSRTQLLFGRESSSRRVHVEIRRSREARLAFVEMADLECPEPQMAPNERSPEQLRWCP